MSASATNQQPAFQKQFLLPKYWGIWLGYGLLRLISFLPYKTKFTIGKKLGSIFYRLGGSRKALARKNISIAFPEKSSHQIEVLLKEHFESLGIGIAEMTTNLWGKHRNHAKNNEQQYFSYKGLENLTAYPDNGILILTPHFTTLETTGLMLSFITSMRPIYRQHDNPLLNYIITKSRSYNRPELEFQISPISNTENRTIIKLLRGQKTIGILPDQKYTHFDRINVPFFGITAPSHPGICKLAKLGKAKILPTFTRRINDRYEMTIHPALENFPSGDTEADIKRLHELYEQEIRENPAQYLWTHNRWALKKNRDF